MSFLLTGASGHLGSYVLRELRGGDFSGRGATGLRRRVAPRCEISGRGATGLRRRVAPRRDLPIVAWSRKRTGALFRVPLQPVDLADADEIRAAFLHANPTCVIHAAAMSRVGDCYENPELAKQVNTVATRVLAELSAHANAKFVFVSTDMVFDGEKGDYCETDSPNALSVYGRTKAAAEEEVLRFPDHIVARISLLYGPALQYDRPGFFDQMIFQLRRGERVVCFEDEWRTPLSYVDAARALLTLAGSEFAGLVHLGGPDRLSRLELGRCLAQQINLDDELVEPGKREQLSAAEPRPRDLSLDSSLGRREFPDLRIKRMSESLEEMRSD